MTQKAFTIGNSVAVTIPKKTGIKPGTRLKFLKAEKGKLVYEIENISPQNIMESIEKTSGSFDFQTKNLMKKIKSLQEKQYDESIRFS